MKPTLHVEQQPQARNIQRADIAPAAGYAIVVDGHFKALFAEETIARKDAAELLAKYPMLKIEIYHAVEGTNSREVILFCMVRR
jgi:hypothetical protein